MQSADASSLDWIQRDNEIAQAARQRLAADPWIPSGAVNVKVEHGWITLDGHVRWYHQKAAVRQDIAGIDDAVGVSNQVTVEPAADDTMDTKLCASKRSWLSEDRIIAASFNGDDVPDATHLLREWRDTLSDALATPGHRKR